MGILLCYCYYYYYYDYYFQCLSRVSIQCLLMRDIVIASLSIYASRCGILSKRMHILSHCHHPLAPLL